MGTVKENYLLLLFKLQYRQDLSWENEIGISNDIFQLL